MMNSEALLDSGVRGAFLDLPAQLLAECCPTSDPNTSWNKRNCPVNPQNWGNKLPVV